MDMGKTEMRNTDIRNTVNKIIVAILVVALCAAVPGNRAFAVVLPLVSQTGTTRGVPQEYFSPAKNQGRIERITYNSKDYAGNGNSVQKVANVYLPYGYGAGDAGRQYDIFYYMHGWSGTADEFFGYGGGRAKNLIDNMIERGDMDPMIIVAPTFDAENTPQEFDRAAGEAKALHQDFLENLMPAIEGRYRTYAGGTSTAALAASRDHRAFGGFSMGSVATWQEFCYDSDYIRYYLPMSSACWYYGGYGNAQPVETCDLFERIIREKNLSRRGFFIYACTGTNDTLRGEMDLQLKEMLSRSVFTQDHLVYYMRNGGMHDYESGLEYIYNALPHFFKGSGFFEGLDEEAPVHEVISDPDRTGILLKNIKASAAGSVEFYDIYSNWEKKRDDSKNGTGVLFFSGSPGAAAKIINAGDYSMRTGDLQDVFTRVLAASKAGENVFILISREGDKEKSDDMRRAKAFIGDSAEYFDITVR